MDYLYTFITLIVFILISPFIIALILVYQRLTSPSIPPNVPWAGLNSKTFFPILRAALREFSAKRDPINEGYTEWGQHGKAFVIPSTLWPEVALPIEDLTWMANQPETILSGRKPQDELLALRYLSAGPDIESLLDFGVLRKDLTRHMNALLPEVMDEIVAALEEQVELDETNWKDVKIFHVLEDVSRRLNNRIFVGLPLCQDRGYLSAVKTWEILISINSAVIRMLVPPFLQPMLAPILAFPMHIQNWKLKRYLLPIIRKRISSQSVDMDAERPNDVLQWAIDEAFHGKEKHPINEHDIASKTILLNFFSVHTISINAGSVLTDILLHSKGQNTGILSQLRSEATDTLPNLPTSPMVIRNMPKLDSTIRESLRLHSMTARTMSRQVVSPTGVTTPGGLHLQQGTHVCIVANPHHLNPSVWERADEFIPFRFSEHGESEEEKQKAKSAVHVTPDFLSFGYGRHACPGRFFAVATLKLLLGYLLTHYEFEPWNERPKNVEMGEVTIPSDKVSVKMRRRRVDESLE